MQIVTRSSGLLAPGSVWSETATIRHKGCAYTHSGAYVTDRHLVAYLGLDATVTDYQGRIIGRATTVTKWNVGPITMTALRIRLIDGRVYTGRTSGQSTLITARRLAAQLEALS